MRTRSAVCLLALLVASELGCNSSSLGGGRSTRIRIGRPTGDLNDPLWYVKVRATRDSEASARGVALLTQHRYDEALAKLDEAIETNPDDHNSLYLAGVASLGRREPSKARDYYDRSIAISNKRAYREALQRLNEYP